MIKTCEEKIQLGNYQNVEVEACDFMKWEEGNKYDYITIGQALHWLPAEEAILKMKDLLNDDGMLTVYGYTFRSLRDK